MGGFGPFWGIPVAPTSAKQRGAKKGSGDLGFARRSTARSQVRNAQTQSQVIHFIEATFNDFHGLGRWKSEQDASSTFQPQRTGEIKPLHLKGPQ